ncbi:MAG: peptidylprolyl isomerase [Planctomycetota bacterium]
MQPQRNRRALTLALTISVAALLSAFAPSPPRALVRAVCTVGTGDDEVAARGGDTLLLWKELDPVFLGRRAMSRDGRAALRHMTEARLLDASAKEFGLAVPESAVDARWKELDRQIQSSGDKEGITGYLRRGRLTRESFLAFLRLAIVQETLTRRALGLPDSAPVTGEQQELWMEETLRERGYVELPPPWKDGVAARTSDFEIKNDEYVRYLRQRLPEEVLREDCYQVLLARRMHARMPDLAPEKLERYVAEEIQRRREEANADPRYNGVPYDRLIATQGILADWLPKDPAVNIAALARAWVDRSYPPDALRRVYADERELFDAQFGDALDTYIIHLRAAGLPNELSPRSFRDAETQLARWKQEIKSLPDFQRRAKESSEDAATRESGGSLGFVTPGSTRVPKEVRAAVADALRRDALPPEGMAVGPLQLPTGVVLLWLGQKHAGGSWETMEKHVHRELRKRFVDEVLPKSSLTTYLELQ